MPELIPAVIYARVSSEMQADAATPIASQIAELRTFAGQNGYKIIKEYVDEGISGRTDNRPAFLSLRAAAESGKAEFESILVWKFDRLFRNTFTAVTFREMLRRKGIKLVSITEPQTDGPYNMLINSVLDALSEIYSLQLAENTLRGQKETARRGYVASGRPPYGFRDKKVVVEGSEKTVREPDPEAADVVRYIFESVGDGVSHGEVARTLTKRNIPSPHGGEWKVNSLHYMLYHNQPAYLGNLIFNREDNAREGVKYKDPSEWIVVENAWEPIITPEMAEKVNARRRITKGGRTPVPSDTPYLLSGLVKCGLCGAPMCGSKASNRARKAVLRYYRCNGSGCSGRQIRKETLEKLVIDDIVESYLTPKMVHEMWDGYQKQIEKDEKENAKRLKAITAAIATLEKKRDNVMAAIENGLDLPELRDRLVAIRRELEIHKAEKDQIASHEKHYTALPLSPNEIADLRERLVDGMKTGNSESRQGIIGNVVCGVSVGDKTVEIHYAWNPDKNDVPERTSCKLLVDCEGTETRP
jgi:site-specific DNA recombinase